MKAKIRIFKPRAYGRIKPIVGHHGQPIQAAELSTPQHGELFAHWTAEDWQRLNAALQEEEAAHREQLRLHHLSNRQVERNEP